MTTQNPDEIDQQAILDQWAVYIMERLDAGHSRTAVQMGLVDAGFTPSDAASFVEYVAREYKAHKRRDGIRSVIFGGILIAAGVGITVFTYSNAEPGGMYLVVWGLPIWGAWKLINGVAKL